LSSRAQSRGLNFLINMKKLALLFIILLSFSAFSQEKDTSNWRVIPSLTDWIEEINNSTDSIYEAKNIKILLDNKKDALLVEDWNFRVDSISENIAATVNKSVTVDGLEFENFFGYRGKTKIIKNIHFKGWFRISNYTSSSSPIPGCYFKNMIFDERFSIKGSDKFYYFNFIGCVFNSMVGFFDFNQSSSFTFRNVMIKEHLQLTRCLGGPRLRITNSNFNRVSLGGEVISGIVIRNSKINTISITDANIESKIHLIENDIGLIELTGAQLPESNTYISFDQVSRKIFVDPRYINRPDGEEYKVSDGMNFELKEDYDLLLSSYKSLLGSYQKRGDQGSYNACYVEMKDIETQRLKYLYKKAPTFKSFFTWKINQFLKLFSAYGTEPARAVIVSLYVILLFAFIYLLFPNSWDKHGKNRIMNRYRFFTKYMNQEAGIHEVYLEEQQQELLESEDFKNYMLKAEKHIPRFFLATAIPLYKWAISGTKLSASILKRVDIMKGTWSELPQSKRIWKSILLIGTFLIAVVYDIFIKMLNALMLSINTFTTLGFGEIPIKGLPRYLAIIQGFIGWFMLTIFSVSLISQLLN